MDKKGFTLVELLGVIVIIGVILVIAIPSVIGISKLIQDNMREKKAEIIEQAAIHLGQDVKGSIMASDKKYDGKPCRSILISDLVPNYLDSDTGSSCINKGGTGCVVDPADNNNYMDEKEIIIYYKNKRIYAIVDLKDNLDCE